MPQVLLQNANFEITVDGSIGTGGMGTASLMGSNDNYVFKQPFNIAELDFQKINWMIAHGLIASSAGHEFCGPVDIGLALTTKEPCGYLMPAAENALDFEYFLNPWIPEEFRLRMLRNAAASLADMHRVKLIRGDWPNFMVDRNGCVFEIDMDSVGINRGDVQYPVTAYKEDTASPEALANDSDHDFSEHDDTWSFSFCAWMLLFNGENPYACQWLGTGPRPPLHERIIRGLWPHDGQHREVGPRRGSKPFSSLDPELQFLLRKVFVDGHSDPTKRPSAADWEQALAKLDSSDDVTLTDAEWKCIENGRVPSSLRLPRMPRIPCKKPLMHAACLTLLGAGGFAVYDHPESIVNNVTQIPGVRQAADWVGAQESEGALTFKQELARIKQLRRNPQVKLHQFPKTPAGATPALWQQLRKGSNR